MWGNSYVSLKSYTIKKVDTNVRSVKKLLCTQFSCLCCVTPTERQTRIVDKSFNPNSWDIQLQIVVYKAHNGIIKLLYGMPLILPDSSK